MKQKILLLILLISGMLYNAAKANEVEPNNNWNQANTLALNGTNNGDLNPAADVDWWKVTTTGDGAINLSLTSTDGRYIYFDLYDTLGTIALHTGTYTNSSQNYTVDGLAKGTYYIKIYCYYGTDTGRYTISNTLTVPAQTNDAEPDSTRGQAVVLPLNGSKTGHIDYYYHNHRDSVDWYKVTTNGDGRLRLTMSSANGQNVWAYLYDNDAKTLIAGSYTTGTAVVVNADGLAAGTYYIRVNTYYNTEFAPYTLSDSLFTSTIANDPEPDSTKALALTLPLNGSAQGHVNYYYNNHKDSVDWYKLTTNADGRIRLTMASANGQNVWAYLFDNDGKTQIAAGYTTGTTVVVNADGLAAGTYYIRVNTYYTSEFAPYTLSDSLFTSTIANDPEPDSTKALALTLPLNGSAQGHVNYYYNNHKDSVDWYKLTTNADGNIRLTMSSANGQNVWAYLFDNDGKTQIAASYTTGTAVVVNADGLAKGTYYIRVNTYYTSEFAPYTLSDSLFTYNANDVEPNKYAKQAKTLNSDLVNNGHVDFYYNNVRDTVDWFKINYTDNVSGNMSVTLNVFGHVTGGNSYTWMQIYKDTAAAPIYNQYTNTSITANLTGLTEGYYYVKVFEYYNGDFAAYTITPTFNQLDVAKVKVISKDTLADCSDTSTLVVKPSGSHSPYTLQLYRFGTAYGNPVTATSGNVTFSGLPGGSYSVRVYGDGATGTAFGKTSNIGFEPTPTGLITKAIKTTSATLNWDTIACVKYFVVQYKVHDSATWLIKRPAGNVKSYVLKGLTAGTTYDWRVASADSANKITAQSAYADSITFTTTGGALVADNNDEDALSKNVNNNIAIVSVSPNPASSYFTIHFNSSTADKLNATLFDVNGKAVWTSGSLSADALNGKQVLVNQFGGGIYYLKIIDSKGIIVGNAKVSVTK